jgi:hypothetical protein
MYGTLIGRRWNAFSTKMETPIAAFVNFAFFMLASQQGGVKFAILDPTPP